MKTVTFIEQIANRISDLGLTTPAIFFLEAHRPFAFIGSQLLLIAQPTLDFFLPQHLTRDAIELLADSNQLDQLIDRLEMNTISTAVVKSGSAGHD
jgi:hypothetical protein